MKDYLFRGSTCPPLTVRIALIAQSVLALGWLAFGILIVAGGHTSYLHLGVYRWIMAALSAAGAIVLFVLTFLLYRRFKPAWYIAVLLLGAMFMAGFMDDLGLVDFVVLGVELVLLGLLIKERKWYLHMDGHILPQDRIG